MGLAASQGRYLCLTARMSDLIYEGQQIAQQRLALAEETSALAEEYNNAVNNRQLQANLIDRNGQKVSQQLTYEILTSKDAFAGLSMRLVDLNGRVVVPKKDDVLYASYMENGEVKEEQFKSSADFIAKYMPKLSTEQQEEYSKLSLVEIRKKYAEYEDEEKAELTLKLPYEDLKTSGERHLIDENCTDPEYLEMMLTSGQWLIEQSVPIEASENENGWDEVVWQGSSHISNVYDTSDDAAAEAKYEAAMKEVQKKDKILELRLEQVQTEENAVEKEIDSIKQVIDKNIEDSFKTFA